MDLQHSSGKNKSKSSGAANKPQLPGRKIRELKLAFSEYYLSLILLQNYQNLNYTGFRKILKKHDKVTWKEKICRRKRAPFTKSRFPVIPRNGKSKFVPNSPISLGLEKRVNLYNFVFSFVPQLLSVETGSKWRMECVETSHFCTSKDIDKLIQETEATVTSGLEGGDRQRAMKRLRVPPLGEHQSPWTTFKVGLFSGSFIILFVAVVLSGMMKN